MIRGFGAVARTIKMFLERHGYNVHLGAWVDIKIGDRLVMDFQIGHWYFMRHPHRGVPAAAYVTTEGNISPKAKYWLREYDYVFAQSKWVKQKLEEIDVDSIYMPVGIDTDHFRIIPMDKFIDVLSIGIWESSWDDRKFMEKVCEATHPYNCYVHRRSTLDYSKLPLLYNMAKIYVCLSGCEGFNIPVVEANACGLPVVYNDACATSENAYGIPVKPVRVYEKLDRGLSYLIHEPNIPVIRRKIHELLSDTKRLIAMGLEARKHALRYDFRKTYRPLLEILPTHR